ncbi:MAG: hypothetical protein ACYTEI_03305 [Planctomycetota bacterium]
MHAHSVRRLSRAAAALALVAAGVMGGCYEEHAPSPQQQPAPGPATVEQPPTGGPETGGGGGGGSALGGARRAAHNTVDSLEEKQKELEKALEDD